MLMEYSAAIGMVLLDKVVNGVKKMDIMEEKIEGLETMTTDLNEAQLMWQDEMRDVQGLAAHIGDQVEVMNVDVVEVKERMGYLRNQMDVVIEDIEGVWEQVLTLEGQLVEVEHWGDCWKTWTLCNGHMVVATMADHYYSYYTTRTAS